MIHYLPVTENESNTGGTCIVKTGMQILKLVGKASAKLIIWLAEKLEGGH